ncbi:MAG: hypothetical protein WC765_05260 [Phycisphaerae bacterium]|jgi:hypothetical protein
MKKFFVLMCVLVVSSIVFAAVERNRDMGREGKPDNCRSPVSASCVEEPKKEKPDNRSVIVDAWLVRVSADALYESGVKPFSEKDKENVSVMNLLWCLSDPNNGNVVVSATTRAAVGNSAKNEFSKTIYLSESTESFAGDNSKPIRSRTQRPYGQKVNFLTYSNIMENKQVQMNWSFSSDFIYGKTDKCPPDTGVVGYQNFTIVPVKKPVIVAQTQIGDDMFFLVLRAEIVD